MDADSRLSPRGERERCDALDVVRGVAVLGILAMNVGVFAMPVAAYSNPTVLFPYEGLNRATYWVVHTLFEAKMMSLFSMLFGAGAVLYARKINGASAARVRWLWIRRMIWLLVIGLVHAYLIWEGDILVSYALCGLMVVWWVRGLRPRTLIVLSAVFLIVSIALSMWFGHWVYVNERPELLRARGWSEAAIASYSEGFAELRRELAPDQAELERQIAQRRGSYADLLPVRVRAAVAIQTHWFVWFIFWRATAMMLLGAALVKLGVLTGERSARWYGYLAAAGYAVGLPMVIGGIVYNESRQFEFSSFMYVGMQFNAVGSVPMALGHAGLVVALVKLGLLGALGRALAAVGRLALSNYLAESVLASVVFYGYGLGWVGRLDRFEQQLVVVGIWVILLVCSPLWLRWFQFGPAEWVWRSLTYRRVQPMRRARAGPAAPDPTMLAPGADRP